MCSCTSWITQLLVNTSEWLLSLPISHSHLPGALFFLRRQEETYLSSSRRVEGFSVSKSISISSGFEFLSEGSLDWIICTTRPSLSPGSLLMSKLNCLFSSYVMGLHFSPDADDPAAPRSSSRLGTGCRLGGWSLFIPSFLLQRQNKWEIYRYVTMAGVFIHSGKTTQTKKTNYTIRA